MYTHIHIHTHTHTAFLPCEVVELKRQNVDINPEYSESLDSELFTVHLMFEKPTAETALAAAAEASQVCIMQRAVCCVQCAVCCAPIVAERVPSVFAPFYVSVHLSVSCVYLFLRILSNLPPS